MIKLQLLGILLNGAISIGHVELPTSFTNIEDCRKMGIIIKQRGMNSNTGRLTIKDFSCLKTK